MAAFLAVLLLLGAPMAAASPQAEAAEEERSFAPWEVEGMYAQARAMLEDKSIQDVSAVPMLLENCVDAGFTPAEFLLLDVYEGKFKGLAPQPEKAADLARHLASTPAEESETAERASMRAEAMFRYALYCERGFGCKEDHQKAYSWMRQAALMGLSRARVELARYLMDERWHAAHPRVALAILLQEERVSPETPNLYFYLGTMCAQGAGLKDKRPNWHRALVYFEKGAALGDARAMNNLGAMYERGIVVSEDAAQALRFYRHAATLGDKNASANWQRLAYKSGISANTPQGTGVSERVDHALERVIHALPLSERTKRRLDSLLTRPTRNGEAGR